MKPIEVAAVLAALTALGLAARAVAQSSRPVGSIDNPKQITSADKGPEIDPVKLAASPYPGLLPFRTFRSFVSSCYALADVWVYADRDDDALYNTKLIFPYP